jgi:hypothetical protein
MAEKRRFSFIFALAPSISSARTGFTGRGTRTTGPAR